MKRLKGLSFVLAAAVLFAACNSVSYKKTKSGLLYKIFPSSGKDSLIRSGNVVKFNVLTKYNDSVMYNSIGKMPGFIKYAEDPINNEYSIAEIMPLLKKGDSAIVVQLIDTLMKKGLGSQLPPTAKKGDRITVAIRITEVYTDDSLARKDYDAEMAKDAPRQQEERRKMMEKMQKEQAEAQLKAEEERNKQMAEIEKSGEKARQIKEVQDYIARKNVKAVQTPKGTFVNVISQGTGDQVADGKVVEIKYSGRTLNDSVFQTSQFAMQVGTQGAIAGMEDGLKLFKEGGKGTIYIPGYLAYGANPPAGSPFKPWAALVFDIEVVSVRNGDTPPQQ
ncbi:FKBP-type peptidyl-prolyl cis-trans isomerase [Nostoc ellipsosporum NOK]|jgi:FKBP-type peptidyl-prolyl cis-trans isomerase FkpA|nr:FKBP-type peptidyl-prolyl cis-trans isomerase [Nostoc ellipsosporum NOK]